MIDAVYTPQEMALLAEAAEHFHRYGRDYSGSYFTLVDTASLVAICGHFLDAYRDVVAAQSEAAPVRITRTEGGFHLLADEALLNLTREGLMEFRWDATHDITAFRGDGPVPFREQIDAGRVALINAVMEKSWPAHFRQADDIPDPFDGLDSGA